MKKKVTKLKSSKKLIKTMQVFEVKEDGKTLTVEETVYYDSPNEDKKIDGYR